MDGRVVEAAVEEEDVEELAAVEAVVELEAVVVAEDTKVELRRHSLTVLEVLRVGQCMVVRRRTISADGRADRSPTVGSRVTVPEGPVVSRRLQLTRIPSWSASSRDSLNCSAVQL